MRLPVPSRAKATAAVVLVVLVGVAAFFSIRSHLSVEGPVVGFESGTFKPEVTDLQVGRFDRLSITRARAYEGARSARATYRGGGPGKARVWLETHWKTGTDVWYGVALFIPRSTRYCYWNPLRWDNYDLYGGEDDDKPGRGDVGGVSIQRGRLQVMQNLYGGEEKTLIVGGAAPTGRWFWLELHQRFSNRDGDALSELYVDGDKRGSSDRANFTGRPIRDLRAGAVNIANECSSPGSIDFDRLSISNRERGPR